MDNREELFNIDLTKYNIDENYNRILRIVSLNLGWIANDIAVFNKREEMEQARGELERLK